MALRLQFLVILLSASLYGLSSLVEPKLLDEGGENATIDTVARESLFLFGWSSHVLGQRHEVVKICHRFVLFPKISGVSQELEALSNFANVSISTISARKCASGGQESRERRLQTTNPLLAPPPSRSLAPTPAAAPVPVVQLPASPPAFFVPAPRVQPSPSPSASPAPAPGVQPSPSPSASPATAPVVQPSPSPSASPAPAAPGVQPSPSLPALPATPATPFAPPPPVMSSPRAPLPPAVPSTFPPPSVPTVAASTGSAVSTSILSVAMATLAGTLILAIV